MTVPVISILVVLAVGFSWLRWRKASYAVAGLALALLLGIGCGPVPAVLLRDLQAGYSSEPVIGTARATAIVLLGNGTEKAGNGGLHGVEIGPLAYGRIVKALELYERCKRLNSRCFILVSGGDPEHHGASEAAVYGAQLQALGVPSADLVLEERSLNTFQNAQYSAAVLSSQPADQVLLVTSGLHLRRSLLYFTHFGVQARPARADFVSAVRSVVPVSYNFLITDLALHEYVGVLRYFVYQRMGWNVQATRARAP